MTPPEHEAFIQAGIPGSELVLFKKSGHFPWLEEPDLFYATVLKFTRRQ